MKSEGHLRRKKKIIVERDPDLICQVSNVLPSVVQHVPHTKDGTERVLLWMVVTAPDLLCCHCGGKVPSKCILRA